MIYIDSKRCKEETLRKRYGEDAIICDVTSQSQDKQLIRLSPFFPHGDIPVPFSDGLTASCVEAIWQGLKVFENCDVDISVFENTSMKNIKRTIRRYGRVLGHRKGVEGNEILDYKSARMQIYVPTYKWMLENISEVVSIITKIKERSLTHDIVFLDYNTNQDIYNEKQPLSHAALVKMYIEGNYPI